MTTRYKRREDWGPSLLAAIPMGVIGLVSLCSPMLSSGPRIVATVGLLGFAGILAICGWPRSINLFVEGDGSVRRSDGRLILPRIVGLRLRSVGDSDVDPSVVRFELEAQGDGDLRCPLVQASDPAQPLTAALDLASRLGIPVQVEVNFTGDVSPSELRCPVTVGYPRPGEQAPAPTAAAKRRAWVEGIPRFSTRHQCLCAAGCTFVMIVLGSILHAQWRRGLPISLPSSLLAALLGAVAILLLDWGLRMRFWIEPGSAARPVAPPRDRTSSVDDLALVCLGILGHRQLLRWGHQTRAWWLLWSQQGGPRYLVAQSKQGIASLRLVAPPDA